MEFDIRIGQHIGYDIAVCLPKRILRNGKRIFYVYAGERSPISVIVCRGDGGTTAADHDHAHEVVGRVAAVAQQGARRAAAGPESGGIIDDHECGGCS